VGNPCAATSGEAQSKSLEPKNCDAGWVCSAATRNQEVAVEIEQSVSATSVSVLGAKKIKALLPNNRATWSCITDSKSG